jgi:hypothetical protein
VKEMSLLKKHNVSNNGNAGEGIPTIALENNKSQIGGGDGGKLIVGLRAFAGKP